MRVTVLSSLRHRITPYTVHLLEALATVGGLRAGTQVPGCIRDSPTGRRAGR
jgi:hypothetical protein